MASIASMASILMSFRDVIPWHQAADSVINAMTIGRIAVCLLLSAFFILFNGRPIYRALSFLFLGYTVGAIWALLTDLVPALFVREIRSLVFRAIMLGNEIMFFVAVLTWARPTRDP